MHTDDFSRRLDRHLDRATKGRRGLGKPQVAVRAPSLGVDYRYGDRPEPFHIASIAKVFTAVLVGMQLEAGRLAPETRIATLLPESDLRGLFRATSSDVTGGATIDHLLSHTSGVNDYFSGRVTSGRNGEGLLVAQPERIWAPAELLAITRERQRPVGSPGERFHYSDTGFVLLGRILEELTGDPFHQQLRARLFEPLGMTSTFMPYRSDATTSPHLAPAYFGNVDASGFTSMTLDWAGGGVASTPDDLLAFSTALHGGRLVGAETLAYLSRPRNTLHSGLRYGSGMITVEIERFAPWMRGYPRLVGGIGILATHLFHDPVHGADIVLNFASTRQMRSSVHTLVTIESLLRRLGHARESDSRNRG